MPLPRAFRRNLAVLAAALVAVGAGWIAYLRSAGNQIQTDAEFAQQRTSALSVIQSADLLPIAEVSRAVSPGDSTPSTERSLRASVGDFLATWSGTDAAGYARWCIERGQRPREREELVEEWRLNAAWVLFVGGTIPAEAPLEANRERVWQGNRAFQSGRNVITQVSRDPAHWSFVVGTCTRARPQWPMPIGSAGSALLFAGCGDTSRPWFAAPRSFERQMEEKGEVTVGVAVFIAEFADGARRAVELRCVRDDHTGAWHVIKMGNTCHEGGNVRFEF